MAYDLIKISALPEATPDESQDIVVGVGDYAKRINYGDVKADMVGTSPTYTTDTEPYLMRRTAHVGAVGKCALNKLVGGSLGWNQLARFPNGASTIDGITYTVTDNNKVAISGTATANSVLRGYTFGGIENHVYYVGGGKSTNVYVTATSASNWTRTPVDYGGGSIGKMSNDARPDFAVVVASGATVNTSVNVIAHDLTQMFGSTIADYVYSLESATAGAGVAWLSKYIDLSTYHAYDAGSIQSVQATAHVTKDADDNVIGNYPLGSDTLRGIPQLVNNELKFDGDIKTPDGTITRKYGYVDLGSLTWTKENTTAGYRFSASFSLHKKTTAGTVPNMICGRYPTVTANNTYSGIYGISNNGTYSSITVCDTSYSDATTFKTAMNGVYLVYELETETAESSTSFQKVQTIDADGTEFFTVSSPVPVGHETQTPDNILAALGWLGE